jgi:hypothetical protein
MIVVPRTAFLGLYLILLVVSLATGLHAATPGRSTPRKLVLRANDCTPLAAAQQEWLTADWQPYLAYTRACPVRNSKREIVLLLVSVHADLYYKAQPGQSVSAVKMPNPLLFLPSGEVVGSLPYNFPDDPPAELRVTFAQWERDFPERIELYLTDPRAGGDRSLPPLHWESSQQKYLPKEK